jgi:hypothetical protein
MEDLEWTNAGDLAEHRQALEPVVELPAAPKRGPFKRHRHERQHPGE